MSWAHSHPHPFFVSNSLSHSRTLPLQSPISHFQTLNLDFPPILPLTTAHPCLHHSHSQFYTPPLSPTLPLALSFSSPPHYHSLHSLFLCTHTKHHFRASIHAHKPHSRSLYTHTSHVYTLHRCSLLSLPFSYSLTYALTFINCTNSLLTFITFNHYTNLNHHCQPNSRTNTSANHHQPNSRSKLLSQSTKPGIPLLCIHSRKCSCFYFSFIV